ncbi:MAG: hypothetical protein QOH99_1661 [Frankiaceae bacterium]|nr:hypothetical protein [Frankiaceae bacterium]
MTPSESADFSAFMQARWPALVRSAVLVGCPPGDAEDLVQAALARVYAQWSRVSAAQDREAYVYRVLLNVLATSRRRRWWGEEPTEQLPDRPDGDGHAEAVAVADSLRSALGALTSDHRAVIVLRFYADMSESQVADALQIAPGTVKSRVSRALGRLAADPRLAGMPS